MTVYRIPLETSGSGSNLTANSYFPVGNTANTYAPNSTKDDIQVKFYGTGYFSNIRVRVGTNSSTSSSTLRLLKNGSPTTLTLTIPSGTSGTFENTSDVVAIADGDIFTYELERNDANAIALDSLAVDYYTTNGKVKYALNQPASFASASSTRYQKITGLPAAYTTADTNSRQVIASNGTLKNASLYVRSNARTSSTTWTLFKNGSSTSISITVSAGATGWHEDTTNTVSVTAGDDFCWQLTNGINTGALTLGSPSIEFDPTTAGESCLIVQVASGLNNNQTRYLNMAGSSPITITADGYRLNVRGSATISDAYFGVATNTATNSTVMTARKNGSDQSITTTFAASTAGVQSDLSNSFTCASGDYMSWKFVRASGSTGTLTAAWISILYAANSESDPVIPSPGGGAFTPYYNLLMQISGSGMNV